VTGSNYRWCRDFAELHGVPIYKNGRKFLIDAPKLFEAIRIHGMGGGNGNETETESPEDATAAVLRSLGLEAIR
jgi:hypothetical protein